MARQKTRSKRRSSKRPETVTRTGATAERDGAKRAPPPAPPTADAPPPRARRMFLLVAAAVVGWWAVLIGLVVFTANPVTLNRRQIRRSDDVATAEVLDAATGRVKVLQEFKHGTPLGEITVEGLSRSGAKTGTTCILPLVKSPDGTYRVAGAGSDKRPPPVYPATGEALDQLRELLKPAGPDRR